MQRINVFPIPYTIYVNNKSYTYIVNSKLREQIISIPIICMCLYVKVYGEIHRVKSFK